MTNNDIQGFSKQENNVWAFVDGTVIKVQCNGFNRIPYKKEKKALQLFV